MRLWSYTMLMVGIVILFNLAGLTGSNGLITLIGYSQNGADIAFNYQNLLNTVLVVISGAAAVGAAASFFGRSVSPQILLASIATGGTLGLFIQSFYVVMSSMSGSAFYLQALVALIVIPLTIGYIVTIINWFGGTD